MRHDGGSKKKSNRKGFQKPAPGELWLRSFLFVSPSLLRVMSNIANRKDSDGWFTQNVAKSFHRKIILNSEIHLELLQPLWRGHCWSIYNFCQKSLGSLKIFFLKEIKNCKSKSLKNQNISSTVSMPTLDSTSTKTRSLDFRELREKTKKKPGEANWKIHWTKEKSQSHCRAICIVIIDSRRKP